VHLPIISARAPVRPRIEAPQVPQVGAPQGHPGVRPQQEERQRQAQPAPAPLVPQRSVRDWMDQSVSIYDLEFMI